MMRVSISIILAVMITLKVNGEDVKQLREMFYQASQSPVASDAFYRLMNDKSENTDALVMGYRAMSEFMKCYHSYNPYNKLAYYNKAKNRLDRAILSAPENIELRYLRFSVQTNVPAFLGYKENIEEDKARIMGKLSSLKNDEQLEGLIIAFLLESSYCNDDEKEKIRREIKTNFR